MGTRAATHAGTWYTSSGRQLTAELDQWLSKVPDDIPGVGHIPIPRSRVIISPHAGYSYSGPCAAWAYRCLDLSKARRIFVLHPSHHYHLTTAALPVVTGYETPLSRDPLPLDLKTIKHLSTLSTTTSQNRPLKFTTMSREIDEAEHSAEMQLPYIHRLLQNLFPDQPPSAYPPLVPIMIGNTSPATEAALGVLLAPYIADETNAFVISSDFCHWGSRFGYTYYHPSSPSPAVPPTTLPNGVQDQGIPQPTTTTATSWADGVNLRSTSRPLERSAPKIYESIAHVDRACMSAIASADGACHDAFLGVLGETGNTVCGRHPIGVFLAGVEECARTENAVDPERGRFRFVRYERSSDAESVRDSSVSYVSAFAVL